MTNKRTVCRTEPEWRSAINRNTAVAKATGIKGAIQIYRGRYFWPLQPGHPGNDYDIETIAHGLAVMPRWGGQTSDSSGRPLRYSTAQHSVHVSEVVERDCEKIVPGWDWKTNPSPALYGLVHDAPEMYGIADLVRPVKYEIEGYKELEAPLMAEVISHNNIPFNPAIEECVRRIDNMMVFLERDELMGQPVVPYTNEADHPRCTIYDVNPDFRVWGAEEAKQRFIDRFEHLINA